MSHKLIDLNTDLKKLRDKGYSVEIIGGYLLVHDIPYVNWRREVSTGTLISKLTLAGDNVQKPDDHVMFFNGEYPHKHDGEKITSIFNETATIELERGVVAHHRFSAKPDIPFKDQYEKIVTYINIISAQAKIIDPTIKADLFKVIHPIEEDFPFKYIDTNSSRAEISKLALKFSEMRIAIVGVGGTGSYILDFVSKTPVKEIYIFDSDTFLQHNAFRAPGAASFTTLNANKSKVQYLEEIYSNIKNGIVPHELQITVENIEILKDMNFVFISIDESKTKKILVDNLRQWEVPFIDVGLSVLEIDGSLMGSVRTTLVIPETPDEIVKKISYEDVIDNDYNQNIQIAELNALNASLAVIKWKKYIGFYHDQSNSHNSLYDMNINKILND